MVELINIKKSVLNAHKKISRYVRETPLEGSPYLSQIGNCEVYLKCENFQLTGSFKIRGAINKLLSLKQSELKRGLVTASSGNHGNAFAYLTRRFGYPGRIVLPENASPAKVAALRLMGTDIEFYGDDCVKAERFARESAVKRQKIFISPYNDPEIIGGQGTVGMEIHRQMVSKQAKQKPDAVLIPVGGGGLISGIAGYLKSVFKRITIIGCQPENSAVMYGSIKAGRIIDVVSRPTLSDGTAGGLEPGAITFDLCRTVVDQFVLVSEDEIKAAIRLILEKHHMLIEGAAALSVAAFINNSEQFKNRNVVLIISGSKIGLTQLKKILC